jgi:MFS family permease
MRGSVVRYLVNRWLLIASRSSALAISAGIPVITFLWLDRGMSRGQFYLLEIFFAAALMLLEVATGRFADRYGKVLTLSLGFAAQAAGSLVYALAESFGDFLLGEVLFALGIALNSGTDEAFMYQSNKALGDEHQQQQWWSVAIGCGFVAMGSFSICGAWLATFDLSYPFLLAFCFGVLSVALCAFMVEPPIELIASDAPRGGSLRQAVSSVLLSSGGLRWMIIAPGFVMSINQTYLWIYAEYFQDCKITTTQSGYIFALFNLIAGASALWLRKIESDQVAIKAVFALLLAIVASTLGLLSVVGVLAWLVIIPQQVVRSVSSSLFSQTINQAIPDEVRVTALSIRNALRVIIYVMVLTPWWLGIDSLGRDGMFRVNLFLLCLAAVGLWLTHPRPASDNLVAVED